MRLLALLLVAATASAQAPPALVVDTNPSGGDGIVSGGTGDARNDDADHPFRPYLVEYRGELYFGATDAAGDREVWRTNGTPEGTVRLPDLNGSGSASPTLFVPYQGNLYFAATAGSAADAYVTDGFTTALYRSNTVPLRVLESTAPTPALYLREDPGDIPVVLGQCRADGSGGPLCANGPLTDSVIDIALAETDGFIVYRENATDQLYKSFGTVQSQQPLSEGQLGDDFSQPSAPYATGSRVFFSCFWEANDTIRGTELCVSTGEPDQTGLAVDLRTGSASSGPLAIGVFGDWFYFRARTDDSPTRTVLFRIRGEGPSDVILERLDPTAGTAPDFTNFNPTFFELGGEIYYTGFTATSGARVWRDGQEIPGMPPDIRGAVSDGETAYLLAADGGPFQVYTFDGQTATPVADVPNGAPLFDLATVYNGDLLYVNSSLYGYGVQPRAIRQPVQTASVGAMEFPVFARDTPLPARFTSTSGTAAGEVRVSVLDAAREPLPADSPALVTLPSYYHLGTDLDALRGDLTLSYADAELPGADEAALGVWQWSVQDQDWAERTVTARDADANTLTVADVRPTDHFVVGTDQPVAGEGGADADRLRLGAPAPNPAATSARVAFSVGAAGPVRLTVHDALGREVARALDRSLPSGEHAARLNLRDLAPGVYLVRLLAADAVEAVPLTVVR